MIKILGIGISLVFGFLLGAILGLDSDSQAAEKIPQIDASQRSLLTKELSHRRLAPGRNQATGDYDYEENFRRSPSKRFSNRFMAIPWAGSELTAFVVAPIYYQHHMDPLQRLLEHSTFEFLMTPTGQELVNSIQGFSPEGIQGFFGVSVQTAHEIAGVEIPHGLIGGSVNPMGVPNALRLNFGYLPENPAMLESFSIHVDQDPQGYTVPPFTIILSDAEDLKRPDYFLNLTTKVAHETAIRLDLKSALAQYVFSNHYPVYWPSGSQDTRNDTHWIAILQDNTIREAITGLRATRFDIKVRRDLHSKYGFDPTNTKSLRQLRFTSEQIRAVRATTAMEKRVAGIRTNDQCVTELKNTLGALLYNDVLTKVFDQNPGPYVGELRRLYRSIHGRNAPSAGNPFHHKGLNTLSLYTESEKAEILLSDKEKHSILEFIRKKVVERFYKKYAKLLRIIYNTELVHFKNRQRYKACLYLMEPKFTADPGEKTPYMLANTASGPKPRHGPNKPNPLGTIKLNDFIKLPKGNGR